MDTEKDNPGVIAFPPVIWLSGAVISTLVHFFVIRLPITTNYRISLVCGIALIVVAPALAVSAVITMLRAGTNVDPAKPAVTIVRSGPFRFTRNPMYLALCFLQIALGFFLNSVRDHNSAKLPRRRARHLDIMSDEPFRARASTMAELFTVLFYGRKNFGCKTAQLCAMRRESEMTETPSVRNPLQRGENPRKNSFLNLRVPCSNAELQPGLISDSNIPYRGGQS